MKNCVYLYCVKNVVLKLSAIYDSIDNMKFYYERSLIVPIRLLIADDDVFIREGLKIIFEVDDRFEVVACAQDGVEAIEYCNRMSIDVALLDIRMPNKNGVEATKEIIQSSSTRVLVLTTFDEDAFIKKAFDFGASGYLLKNNSPEQIKTAVISVNSGNMVLQEVILNKIKSTQNNEYESNEKKHFDKEEKTSGDIDIRSSKVLQAEIDRLICTEYDLSRRELEIIQAIAEGYSNKEIAERLYISEGTVKNYVSSLLSKLTLNHRTQIAIMYLNMINTSKVE